MRVYLFGEQDMGKGDTRTRRGKIYQGSFGKSRPKDPVRAKKRVAKKTGTKK
jgi:30S ribosomal protein S31